MKRILILATAVLLLTGTAHAGLINGDFETGDFTGWTTYDMINGISSPTVSMFDVDNDTNSSYAARFQVGHLSGSPALGGGITQDLDLLAGTFDISADIASYSPNHTNSSGGRFYLYLDSTLLDSYDFGGISTGTTEFAQLSGSTTVTEGSHTLKFEMTRPYTVGSFTTPYQYIDDVSLAASFDDEIEIKPDTNAVPEPMTMLLFGTGLVGFALKRKK